MRDGIGRAAGGRLRTHGYNSLVTDQNVPGKRVGAGSVDNEPITDQGVCWLIAFAPQ